METGLAVVTGRMLALLPASRAAALAGGPVTIDLDTTDVEVYGRKKRGVAYNHQGQRVGRPHVAAWPRPRSRWPTWATAPMTRYNGHRPHQSRQQRPPDIETQPTRDVADLRSCEVPELV